MRSEGAAIVALSRWQAQTDGDRICAVIHGSAVGNDGRSSGSMGTPSRIGQEGSTAPRRRDAGVPASRLHQYVEAHGTGTHAGDPVELLPRLGPWSAVAAEAPVYVGSVKTNIGRTEGAAGIGGLIRFALALYRNEIPATASRNQTRRSRGRNWASKCRALYTRGRPADSAPSRASAHSSPGRTHVVLGETPASATTLTGTGFDTRTPVVTTTPASGRAGSGIAGVAAAVGREFSGALRFLPGAADLLSAQDAPALQDVCWNAAVGVRLSKYRAACVGNRSGWQRAASPGGRRACMPTGTVHENGTSKIAFRRFGQGGQ